MEPSPPPPSSAASAAADAASPSTAATATATATASTTGGGGGDDGVCEQGKLFVGGIRWDATEDVLRDYFGKYGEVAEAIVMKDKGTGNARGFGFVSFVDPSAADRAIQDSSAKHSILGRPVEVKRALPRNGQHQNRLYHNDFQHQNGGLNNSNSRSIDGSHNRTKKIFVGGLSANLTQEEFKSYFEKFGRITDVVVMYDRTTNRPRGFGFITFDTEESVDNAVQNTFQTLNGKTVEVKRAVPSEGNTTGNNHSKNRDNRNGYSPRINKGRVSSFNSHFGGICSPYHPRFGFLQAYGAPSYIPLFYGPGAYSGGYACGGYGFGYGAPYATLRSSWTGPGFMGSRQGPVTYGTAGFYPDYLSGDINPNIDTRSGGYPGSVSPGGGNWNQSDNDSQLQAVTGATLSNVEDRKLNAQGSSDC